MNRPRAADDFATIRARLEELRLERAQAKAGQTDLRSDPPTRPRPSTYWYSPNVEPGAGPNRDRRSGPKQQLLCPMTDDRRPELF